MTNPSRPIRTALRISCKDKSTVNAESSVFQESSSVIEMAEATEVKTCPWPTRTPNTAVIIRATDVVSSSDRSANTLRKFKNPTSSTTPIREMAAKIGSCSELSIPKSAVNENVRKPTSLRAHSLSNPTSRPMPSAIKIFVAIWVGGNTDMTGSFSENILSLEDARLDLTENKKINLSAPVEWLRHQDTG